MNSTKDRVYTVAYTKTISQPTHSFFKIIDDVKSPISNILVLEIGDKIIETLKWS